MKKFLAILLAVAMIFSLSAVAMAADTAISYPDVADQTEDVQFAIYRLSALDVICGYTDGTYQPNGAINRAEFAKIADIIAAKAEDADLLKPMKSVFSDVASNLWYSGYINAAHQNNIVKGYPDGTFLPKNNVTMAEALTMLMRVLGYGDNLVGNWPYDYIMAANDLGVLDGLPNGFVASRAATRAEVAVMASNLLDMYLVTSGDGSYSTVIAEVNTQLPHRYDGTFMTFIPNDGQYLRQPYTVLEHNFFVEAGYEVFYDDEYLTEAAAWGYEDFDKNELLVAFFGSGNDQRESFVLPLASKYYMNESFLELAHQGAEIMVNDDGELIFAWIDTDALYVDEIEEDGDTITADKVDYEDYLCNHSDDVANYGRLVVWDDEAWSYKDYSYFEDMDFNIVESVDAEYINFNTHHERYYYSRIAISDEINTYEDYVIYKDGKQIAAKDLKAGDVVYAEYLNVAGEDVILMLVNSPDSGKATKRTVKALTVAGEAYAYAETQFSANNGDMYDYYDFFADFDLTFLGHNAKYVVGYAWQALDYFAIDTEDYVYGVITDIDSKDKEVTVYTLDEKEVVVKYDADTIWDANEEGDLVNIICNKDGEALRIQEVVDFDPDYFVYADIDGKELEVGPYSELLDTKNLNVWYLTTEKADEVTAHSAYYAYAVDEQPAGSATYAGSDEYTVKDSYTAICEVATDLMAEMTLAGYDVADQTTYKVYKLDWTTTAVDALDVFKSVKLWDYEDLLAVAPFYCWQLEAADYNSANEITELYTVYAWPATATFALISEDAEYEDGYKMTVVGGGEIPFDAPEDIIPSEHPSLIAFRAWIDGSIWTEQYTVFADANGVNIDVVDEEDGLFYWLSWTESYYLFSADEMHRYGASMNEYVYFDEDGLRAKITKDTIIYDMDNNKALTQKDIDEEYAKKDYDFFAVSDKDANLLYILVWAE